MNLRQRLTLRNVLHERPPRQLPIAVDAAGLVERLHFADLLLPPLPHPLLDLARVGRQRGLEAELAAGAAPLADERVGVLRAGLPARGGDGGAYLKFILVSAQIRSLLGLLRQAGAVNGERLRARHPRRHAPLAVNAAADGQHARKVGLPAGLVVAHTIVEGLEEVSGGPLGDELAAAGVVDFAVIGHGNTV